MFDCANTYNDVTVYYKRTPWGSETIYATIDGTSYDTLQLATELQSARNKPSHSDAVEAFLMYFASGSFAHTRNMEMFADCVRLVHSL